MPLSRDQTLKLSIVEGGLYAVMLGASESYLGAFAVELGHGPHSLAVLSTLPLLFGAVSQLCSVALIRLLGSRKRLVVFGAALQALSMIGLVLIALTAEQRMWPLLLTKTVFWVSGSVMAPAWGDWIGVLTQGISRPRYFGIRSGVVNAAMLAAFLAAGFSLHGMEARPLTAYAWMFAGGMTARGLSCVSLVFHSPGEELTRDGSVWDRTRQVVKTAEWRVAVYLAALFFGAHISVPFFIPYMLRELGLDYQTFAWLSAVSIFTKAVVFPFAHLIAARLSLRNLLTLSGVGIALVPLVWSASTELSVLVFVHVLSGLAWAGLEYTSFQMLLEAAPERTRTEFLALANSLAGVGQLAGALTGAVLLASGGLSYRQVFVVSALLRTLPLALLIATTPSWAHPRRWARAIYTRLFSVRPTAGASLRPIPVEEEEQD